MQLIKSPPSGGSSGTRQGDPSHCGRRCNAADAAGLLGCRCGRPDDSFLTLNVQAHQWATFSVDLPWSDKNHVAKIACHDVCLYSMHGTRLGSEQDNRQMTAAVCVNLAIPKLYEVPVSTKTPCPAIFRLGLKQGLSQRSTICRPSLIGTCFF